MGQAASRVGRKSNGIIVTLDALGTLYKFRKPVAVQYLDVAQRAGVKHDIKPDQLLQAFKKSYKEQVLKYPNYGFGKLNDPSEWWGVLVKNTFSQLVQDVPEELPQQLYNLYSSAEAYELHPDVQPFLQSMHNLRNKFQDPHGPSILTGVVTNSDPRVAQVLRALSLTVGDVKIPTRDEIRQSATVSARSGVLETPWSNAYDPKNDFDFLITGYEAGAEKPDAAIWQYAEFQASLVATSKTQKAMVLPEGRFKSAFTVVGNALSNIGRTDNMQWIHIGDEYEKDYVGAMQMGREALLLDREGTMNIEANKIENLEAAATVVSLMAQDMLKSEVE